MWYISCWLWWFSGIMHTLSYCYCSWYPCFFWSFGKYDKYSHLRKMHWKGFQNLPHLAHGGSVRNQKTWQSIEHGKHRSDGARRSAWAEYLWLTLSWSGFDPSGTDWYQVSHSKAGLKEMEMEIEKEERDSKLEAQVAIHPLALRSVSSRINLLSPVGIPLGVDERVRFQDIGNTIVSGHR